VREYGGYSSQISSASFRPLRQEAAVVDTNGETEKKEEEEQQEEESKNEGEETMDTSEEKDEQDEQVGLPPMSRDPNIMLTTSIDGNCLIWDRREPTEAARRLSLPDKTPPWALSVRYYQGSDDLKEQHSKCWWIIGMLECRWVENIYRSKEWNSG
jgi:transcriptional activator SPT8